MSVFVHSSSYVEEDVKIGEGTKIWYFCHIQKGSIIGNNCLIGQNVFISNGSIVGNNCKIMNNVSVYEGVELEDGVFCGPSCVFTNDLTPRAEYPKGSKGHLKTIVKHGATIGANSTIVCGNIIGKYAMIAAGSVVTKNVSDYALVAGNPARQIGYVCECGFKLNDEKLCEKCGKQYIFVEERLERIN